MIYPEKKQRELSLQEKQDIRRVILSDESGTEVLAKKFGCSTSQIAGVKAAMNRRK